MRESSYPELNNYDWVNHRYSDLRRSDVEIAAEVAAIHEQPVHRATVARARNRLGIKGRGRGKLPQPSRFDDRDWLAGEIGTKSFVQIGRENGCSAQKVSAWAKKYGLSAPNRSEAISAGLSKRYGDAGRTGSRASNWRGGRIKRGAYWWLHRDLVAERWPDHPRLFVSGWTHKQEHILVMEAYVGRVLQPGEDVHHGPGGKEDNSIENLTLMSSRGAHISEHWSLGKEAAMLGAALDEVRELLPAVYDGTHLVDCPYVDVLRRIAAVVDGVPRR